MSADSRATDGTALTARAYGWIAVLGVGHAVGSMSFTAIVAMAPIVRDALDLTATRFGFLVSAYFFVQAVLGLPVGGIIDRIGVRWALIISNLMVAAGILLMSIAEDFATAVTAMIIAGLAYGFVNPATSKGVLDWIPAQRRGTAMGLKQSGVPFGGLLGAGIGALATVIDWRQLLYGVAASAAVAILATLVLPAGPRRGAAASRSHIAADLKKILLDRNLTVFNVGVGIYQAGQFNFFSYITLFMRDAVLASQPLAAACIGLGQAASAVGRLGWGAVSDFLFRGRRKPVLMIMGSIGVLSLIGLATLSPGWGVPAGVALTLLIGLTVAGYVALVQTIVVEAAEPDVAATAVGYNRFFTAIGASVGPPLFGMTVDVSGDYVAGWLMTGAIVLAATAMIGAFFREGRGAPRMR